MKVLLVLIAGLSLIEAQAIAQWVPYQPPQPLPYQQQQVVQPVNPSNYMSNQPSNPPPTVIVVQPQGMGGLYRPAGR